MTGALETQCGRIRFLPPSGQGRDLYWRIEWYEGPRRRQTTAGRTQASAEAKAAKVLAALDLSARPEALTPLGHVLDDYVRWGLHNWAVNHNNAKGKGLPKLLAPFRQTPCHAVDGRMLRGLCHAASTKQAANQHKSWLHSFLVWGRADGYFTVEQTQLLDEYRWVPPPKAILKPTRKDKSRTNGEGIRFIAPAEVPSHAAVRALADAQQKLWPQGRLFVELAAASGLRLAEQLALKATHVTDAERTMCVEQQALSVRDEKGERLALPKGNKVRTSVYPEVSATGYPLACEVKDRLEEIDEEFKNGKNPYRLLFPAPKGGYWWPTSYSTDRFTPAAIEAGWQRQTWRDEQGRKRHQWVHTHHSLRHRFAQDAIELWKLTPAQLTYVGGWESIAVVFERYYGLSGDILGEVQSKTAANHR